MSGGDKAISVPVQFEESFDVVVVGGGTTGVVAALAAARHGAKTAIVEINGFLGGNATTNLPWFGFHNSERELVVRGIPLEIIERLHLMGGASEFHFDPIGNSVVAVNPSWLKIALARMLADAGVEMFLHSLAIGVATEGNRVTGVYIQNKQGCQQLVGEVFVDCTDTGDVAVKCGARYEFGRDTDNKVQASSYAFTVGGIDFAEMLSYFEANPDQLRPFPLDEATLENLLARMRTAPLFVIGAFPELMAKASQDGLTLPRDRMIGVCYPQTGEAVFVTSRVENVNANDVRNLSRAEIEGVLQIEQIMEFIKRYMPGGSAARLVGSAHQIGIRETRHIIGDYCLTGEDLLAGKRFDDVIALGGYHLDIHSPDRKGLEPYRRPPTYEIPYRSLLPQGVEGILVAGRIISANHEAESSTRVVAISAAQGQAAGTAAALAVKAGVLPRVLDVHMLQAALIKDGAEIGQGIGRR